MPRFPKIPRGAHPAVVVVVLAAAILGSFSRFSAPGRKAPPAAPVNVMAYAAMDVAHVYDGDTIRLANGEKVRFIGIDTPESIENKKLLRDAARSGTAVPDILRMGHKASLYTKSLLEGRRVRLEFDIETRDKYGRLLAYVYRVDDGLCVNEDIIRNGYAYPMTIPPNIRYADKFRQAFREARKAGRGLWQDPAFQASPAASH